MVDGIGKEVGMTNLNVCQCIIKSMMCIICTWNWLWGHRAHGSQGNKFSLSMVRRKPVGATRVDNGKGIGVDGWSIAKIEETTYKSGIISLVFRL
jgi:hypothetical protein